MRRGLAALVVVVVLAGASDAVAVRIEEAAYEGRPHLVVFTERASWFFDRAGGGLSRLVDRDGRDWISFGADPLSEFPGAAASGFRGLPNAVFVGPDKGSGHPGFDRCTSEVVGENVIRSVCGSGRWAWTWRFAETTATFEMESADPEHAWWFLYEGPIAGSFEPGEKLWGSDRGGPRLDAPGIGRQLFEPVRFVYFADRRVPRTLFLIQHEADELLDTVWYLGSEDGGASHSADGMMVFGFGRGPGTEPLFRGAGQRFTVGLLEERVETAEEHARLARIIESAVGAEPSSRGQREVDIWYGDEQSFGSRGEPQRFVNVLGRVGASGSLESLRYRLNGGEPRPLSVGSDLHRLARPGDFNVELAWGDFEPGANDLQILASWEGGAAAAAVVRLDVRRNRPWPLPYEVDFSQVTDLQDVVQVVDGRWELTKQGVRTREPWYDRVLALGDGSWSDYEATVSLTLHGHTPSQRGPPTYGVTHMGLGLRWRGHTPDGLQPSRQWYPLGAATEFLIQPGGLAGRFRILADGGAAFREVRAERLSALDVPRRFWLKGQVVTLADGRSRYRVRQWNEGEREPSAWAVESFEPAGSDVAAGSLLLVSHNTDVTIHRVSVVPVTAAGGRSQGENP